MAIDRRHFLIGTALALSANTRAFAGVLASEDEDADDLRGDLIAACRRPDGTYSVVVLTLDGMIVRELPLKGRGHDIACDKASGWAVVFARRPGSFALAFDVNNRHEPILFAPPSNRHLYGHGVFSHDGRLLYATEHDNETRQGIIGVYNATAGFRRIGELPTYGIGPHEAILLSDGKTLAIANGGIETHIETGRKKLNVESMEPSLAFVDATNGTLLAQHKQSRDLHKLSIRHVAADGKGRIWFGAQWEGEAEETPELIGYAGLDTPVRILDNDIPMGASLAGYIGAVAIDGDKRVLAASAPRAGRIVYVDTEQARVISDTQLMDSCGVTSISKSEFAMSSGMGVLRTEQPDHTHLTNASFPGWSFDNHLRLIR